MGCIVSTIVTKMFSTYFWISLCAYIFYFSFNCTTLVIGYCVSLASLVVLVYKQFYFVCASNILSGFLCHNLKLLSFLYFKFWFLCGNNIFIRFQPRTPFPSLQVLSIPLLKNSQVFGFHIRYIHPLRGVPHTPYIMIF